MEHTSGTTTTGESREAVEGLFDRLSAEDDERAVLSVIYQRRGGDLVLRHGSLLVGPAEMAQVAWAKWRADSAERLAPRFEELSQLPADLLVSEAPTEDGTELITGRVAMAVDDAREVLVQAMTAGTLPLVGPLSQAHAQLSAPDALLTVFPRLWTPTARLAASAAKPLSGLLFPRAEALPPVVLKTPWIVGGIRVHDGSWSSLGIAMPHVGHRIEPPAQGLLVGRLERRAWFDDVKGDGEFNTYELYVGFEPQRVDVADLEVELEEWAGEELANVRRLPLGEIALGSTAKRTAVLVRVPTLGRGLAHVARLYDREGALLDRTQKAKLLERLEGRFRVSAGDSTGEQKFTIGERVKPTVADRLERLDRLEADYRDMFKRGLETRIVTDPGRAVAVVRDQLNGKTGELWVMDPYFGSQPGDWAVLQGLPNDIKVLSGQAAEPPPTPMPNVSIKRWNGGGPPPFHDRVYLWLTGALTVGTSPSGLGKRDARVDRLRRTEADGWRARFTSYWASPDFVLL